MLLFFFAKYSDACGSVKKTMVLEFLFFASFLIDLRIDLWPKCRPSKFPIVAENLIFGNLFLKRLRLFWPLIRYILF
jgi:hypothetical protein